MKISLIVPCYNEQEALPIFYEEVIKIIDKMQCEYEIIFVNDGSKDKTLEILKKFSKKNENVTYLSFSRNFGKEAAMYAGFCNVGGDYIAVMDADMQDPPSLLPTVCSWVWATASLCAWSLIRMRGKFSPPRRFLAGASAPRKT